MKFLIGNLYIFFCEQHPLLPIFILLEISFVQTPLDNREDIAYERIMERLRV